MLRLLNLSLLILFSFASIIGARIIDTSGFAASVNDTTDDRSFGLRQEFSWIKGINLQAQALSKTHQIEAKALVEAATNAASKSQHCEVAKSFANKTKEIGRKNLRLNGEDETVRYPKLLVFVSFSMPIETLKALGSQVNQVGGKIVFRGLINGSFKETIERLKELQEEVIIDPTLFEVYQIKGVPTFILRQKPTENFDETEPHDRLQGNVSLSYALEQFASYENPEASQFLQLLRRRP